MIRCFRLGAFEVVHRVVQQGVLTVNAAVLESGNSHGLLAPVLWLLLAYQMNLSTHFDRAVECVN